MRGIAINSKKCGWCGGSFKPRASGGNPQRFCSQKCRHAFGTAARRWVTEALNQGLMSLDVLNPPNTACALNNGPSHVNAADR